MASVYKEHVLLDDWAGRRHPSASLTNAGASYYYASCYLAGGLSSGIRWVLTPLELIKTRAQVSVGSIASTTSAGSNIFLALRSVHAQQGITGLFRGLQPTAAAYWLQTSTKYSLYEVLKHQLSANSENSKSSLVYVAAAATAETVASVLMCPFEMLRVQVMTNHTFPSNLKAGWQKMMLQSNNNFPVGGNSLFPLLARQIPCTVVNFFTFETTGNMIYEYLQKPKEDYTVMQRLGVTFCAGYTAGFCAAVVSHPADSLVSLLALRNSAGNISIREIVRETGLYKLATTGLAPRILITGNIISVQWLLYDTFKSLMGYGTTGGW